jgi:membrane associated rhomboid family serine protease
MSEAAPPLRETLLRQIVAADPGPWYPKEYAQATGADRESLYGPLNDLRVANLVQLTDWIAARGQGYVITPLGREVLNDPTAVAHLRDGVPVTAPAPSPEQAATADAPTTFEIGEAARRAIFQPGRAHVAPVLIGMNIIAFAASFAVAVRLGVSPMDFLNRGDVRTLHDLGAVGAPDIAHGEWWRLLTTCFLHFGLMHITLNMTSLFLSRRVEVMWGSGRFLVLYLICGVCGSCAAVYYHPGEVGAPVYLAGASGALWGVMTSAVVWLILNRSHLPPADVRHWLQQMFFTLLLNVGVSMLPGVSAAAHFGGGIAGALAAVLLRIHKNGPPPKRSVAAALLAGLPALFLLGLAEAMEHDPRLEPFVAEVYREQIEPKVGKLPPALDDLEPQAERLFIQPVSQRNPADATKVQEQLNNLAKQAKDAGDWARNTKPVDAAKPMRDKGIALADALTAYADALAKEASGEPVRDINDLRKSWQDARAAWQKVTTKVPAG